MTGSDLKRLERSTFLAAADSGLWDMFLAGIFSMLAIGPLLSVRLGDFWSSAVFLPVFAVALFVIHLVQTRVIRPRLGVVQFGPSRVRRLRSLGWIMLVVNLIALGVGALAATGDVAAGGWSVPLSLSLVLLSGCSLGAFFLQIPRVFAYGLLLGAAPLVGEALFQRGYATHHGFPIVFGVCATTILVSGIVRFVRFLPPASRDFQGPSTEGNHG